MATFSGLVNTLQVRDDGWVEVIMQAVHANNATNTFYIKDLDGDITMAHKRLGQLSLLRDAITRILPVEIIYNADKAQGNLIEEVIIHPRPSITGRNASTKVQGTVIGVAIQELGPSSGSSPYRDPADLAGITLLQDDGTILYLLLDLQREEALTMQAMLALLQAAHKNRRPVAILLSGNDNIGWKSSNANNLYYSGEGTIKNSNGSYIEACEWITLPEASLDYHYAFIERLGQRYESFTATEAPAISHTKVVYTTSPGQTPEGDLADNGSFQPNTNIAWVPVNSPLWPILKTALKKCLQVKLGLVNDQIHAVEVVSPMGSAARPIWICINQAVKQQDNGDSCDNNPTIQTPTNNSFNNVKINFCWKAQGYFNEGIWRFEIKSPGTYELKVDGHLPCCGQSSAQCCCETLPADTINHFYLRGLHNVQLSLYNKNALETFALIVYRIR